MILSKQPTRFQTHIPESENRGVNLEKHPKQQIIQSSLIIFHPHKSDRNKRKIGKKVQRTFLLNNSKKKKNR
jgi:hypothetical protein